MLTTMSTSPDPPAHIGIVGAGQLARMTLQAAIPLGLRLRLLAERPDDGAALIAPDVLLGSPNDHEALLDFARGCEVVTFDHELVPPPCLDALIAAGTCLRPSAATMRLAQDKSAQRRVFAELGLPVPPFQVLSRESDLAEVIKSLGSPLVLKAARGGYDGRGVWIVDGADNLRARFKELTASGIELIAERWVPIERELAILIARRPGGQTAVYPLVETVQVEGICREVILPAPVSPGLAAEAEEIARTIAEASDVVGILAVELFLAGGRLIVNEIATRPHNSGHYSIEGCVTSQFEQHLRAILDWPLGATAPTAPAVVTVNILGGPTGGDPFAALPCALGLEGTHVHLYGKGARPGRKLGHVTVCASGVEQARRQARKAAELLSGAPIPGEVAT
ncbi:MAG: 5-(carboxyamino)imidazole ribonucleotide synthase [Thermomicrobiales bacterium]|nr:5-(carboxyamino)imidazole ribonucleotide synthase [Thermomicrobiales bacterium]